MSLSHRIMLVFAFLVVACQCEVVAKPQTLETLCDKVKILEAKFALANFEDSCALLENSVRQALLNAPEYLSAASVASAVSLKVDTAHSDKHALTSVNCTIRELLNKFALTWNVTVTITGNQIIVSKAPK